MAERRAKLVEEYYKNSILNAEILIDNVWDPHNVAALSRTADGLGIRKINLYYTHNKFPDFEKLGKKSSSSANKWVKFERIDDLKKFISEKKSAGFQFIGAELSENAEKLTEFVFPDKTIIVLGSERDGMSSEIKEICDKFVSIPMTGMVESYNISVAAGIIMYELFRQKGKNLSSGKKELLSGNKSII